MNKSKGGVQREKRQRKRDIYGGRGEKESKRKSSTVRERRGRV